MTEVRDGDAPVLLLDGGDLFGNLNSVHSLDDMLKGEYLLTGMEMCGYDALTLGERDFRFGETFVTEHTADTDMVVTAANVFLHGDGTAYATRYFTKDFGELTVGVIGIMSSQFAIEVAELSSADGEEIEVGDPLTALAAVTEEMGPVDLTVLLAHLPLAEGQLLAPELAGVDVMILAHEPAPPQPAEQLGNVWVVTPGYDGKWIGHLDLEVAEGSVVSLAEQSTKLGDDVADDPDLADLYQDYLERVATEIEEIINSIPEEVPTGGSYVGAGVCASCHPSVSVRWSTTAHAQAFDTMVATNHDYAPSCFPCHTTGFGYLGGFKLPDLTPDMAHVQCESCHGAGADHVAAPAPGWSDPTTACTGCHTAEMSPNFSMVDYLPEVTCAVHYGPAPSQEGCFSKMLPLP